MKLTRLLKHYFSARQVNEMGARQHHTVFEKELCIILKRLESSQCLAQQGLHQVRSEPVDGKQVSTLDLAAVIIGSAKKMESNEDLGRETKQPSRAKLDPRKCRRVNKNIGRGRSRTNKSVQNSRCPSLRKQGSEVKTATGSCVRNYALATPKRSQEINRRLPTNHISPISRITRRKVTRNSTQHYQKQSSGQRENKTQMPSKDGAYQHEAKWPGRSKASCWLTDIVETLEDKQLFVKEPYVLLERLESPLATCHKVSSGESQGNEHGIGNCTLCTPKQNRKASKGQPTNQTSPIGITPRKVMWKSTRHCRKCNSGVRENEEQKNKVRMPSQDGTRQHEARRLDGNEASRQRVSYVEVPKDPQLFAREPYVMLERLESLQIAAFHKTSIEKSLGNEHDDATLATSMRNRKASKRRPTNRVSPIRITPRKMTPKRRLELRRWADVISAAARTFQSDTHDSFPFARRKRAIPRRLFRQIRGEALEDGRMAAAVRCPEFHFPLVGLGDSYPRHYSRTVSSAPRASDKTSDVFKTKMRLKWDPALAPKRLTGTLQ